MQKPTRKFFATIVIAGAPLALLGASKPQTRDGAVRVAAAECSMDACDAVAGRCESTNGYHLPAQETKLGAVVTEVAMEVDPVGTRVVNYAH